MMTEAKVKQVKRQVAPELLALPAVSGVGICDAEDAGEGPALAVYVAKAGGEVTRQIRQTVRKVSRDVPVRVLTSGTFAKSAR